MRILLIGLVVLAVAVLVGVRLLRGRLPEAGTTSGNAAVSGPFGPATEVVGISITLEIADTTALFVLLGAGGSINRKGTGRLENTEQELFIGKTDPAVFEAVRLKITQSLMQRWGNTYELANPRGAPCVLSVAFHFRDKGSGGFRFLYGSESERVPEDVAKFVIAAVKQTDPWYEDFKRNVSRRQSS